MSIPEKYNMSKEDFKRSICDGIISNSVLRHDEIIGFYNQKIAEGMPKSEIVKRIEHAYGITIQHAYRLINKYT